VRIRELTLRPFRNFDQFHLPFEADHVLIFGPNGRGKTNILEAISYLSIGKSVRGARDQQAVPHGGDYFDIQGLCSDGRRDQKLRIFYSRRNGKKVFCDESPLPRVSDVFGVFKTVHFSPEDVSLVLRFPAQRRRLLDILISQSSPSYLRDLQRYQRVLTQRNYLLRTTQKAAQRAPDVLALEPWNAQLIQLGAGLRARRLEALEELRALFAAFYARFAPEEERVTLDYRGTQAKEEGALEEEFKRELRESQGQESRLGHTLCGPHRDDLVFILNDRPADSFASEGQLKSILISWKMAEVCFLDQQSGNQPVLLLDDVFSELDKQRVGELLEIIDGFEQVLVTTPQELGTWISRRFAEIELHA